MKILILSLLFVFPLGAANFIDNPNLDLDWPNCEPCLKQGRKDWMTGPFVRTIPYKEHTRHAIIHDQYFEYSWEQSGYSGLQNFGRWAEPGVLYYGMEGVPNDSSLYFAVEIGHEGDKPIHVQIELHEVAGKGDMRGGNANNFESHVLSRKIIEINDKSSWSLITSDYPVYKNRKGWPLLLIITFPKNALNVQLNYAQVGTDPKDLGGRGARKKNFNKKDEL